MTSSTWQVRVTVAEDLAGAAEKAFEEADALAVSTFAAAPGCGASVTALFDAEPAPESLRARIARALGTDAAVMPVRVEEVADRDWVAQTVRAFPPLAIGPFWVHGSHAAPPDLDRIPILMDAGAAFGSGEHATTEGCLLALAALHERGFRPANALDMGCGSGILAIAAVKLHDCSALAVDIDPEAAGLAREAARRNGAARRVAVLAGDGYATPAVGERAPYDLALANILANPLIAMAPDLAAVLKPGGVAVLSGMLADRADAVRDAHRAAGLALLDRRDLRGWATLTMTKG